MTSPVSLYKTLRNFEKDIHGRRSNKGKPNSLSRITPQKTVSEKSSRNF